MPHEVTMPQLGMAQDAGRLTQWLKAPGDKVAKGDALFEVETDKATMEVEAQASGFLTHVTATEGADVPVGQAIARISESADDDTPAPAADTAADTGETLPEGREITMPQLGMAQDSGVLVGWLVDLGAQVGADDLLFEVETDKATMDVPAGMAGYLAATLAQAGDAVPVGQAVAVISASKPAAPVARAMATAAPAPKREAEPAETPDPAPASKPAQAAPAVPPQSDGRILASPKLRRVALEQGLDLALLVRAGHPQPYHMRDLEMLRSLKDAPATAAPVAAQSMRLHAECAEDGFAPFAQWAAEAQGLTDADALLAGLAGASMGGAATVAIERFGTARVFAVPKGRRLSAVAQGDAAPDLRVRDLRATPLRAVSMGAEDLPVLTLMQAGTGLAFVLECHPDQIAPDAAIALLSEFAGRMHDPLRHLL